MAVQLENFNIIIPRSVIDGVYEGGSEAFIKETQIGDSYFDEKIVRIGASDSLEIGTIIEEWTARGLRDIRKRKGKRTWIDLCLIDTDEGLTLPCRWISIEGQSATFTGKV